MYWLSVGTNITTTISIWYFTWLHRKTVLKYIKTGNHGAHSEKVLILLLESGVIHIAFQILYGMLLYVSQDLCTLSFAWKLLAAILETIAASVVVFIMNSL
ncbi:hypothetical protein MPER_01789 [Moniliophthora perniciosa FA553]|nr:hypothetical protein MPER_01789 [Moniliophthora perniciosa FA553]